MDCIHLIGWSILIILLFISSFGFTTIYILLVSLVTFVGGIVTVLHFAYNKEISDFFNYDTLDNPLDEAKFSMDLPKVLEDFKSSKQILCKFDQRITGSETLDAFLNEIFNIIISDYVTNWYQVITSDDEFVNSSLKQTVIATSVNLSNRIKGVDWTPFITKQVLEEITTHIKLFKKALVRIKQLKIAATDNVGNTSKPIFKNVAQEKKTSVHKRNKSDTDVNRYPDVQKYGTSQFISCNSEINFEAIFFELESLLEEKIICRDAVCLDPEKESELLCELSEAVLYILAPPETWQCSSLKFIIVDLLASVVLRPLISLLSDPDNINRLIIRTCCGDNSLSSDLFLNVLRSSDDVEELTATYNLVEKEIQKLHSRDMGGESELWVRQQLSSLQYLQRAVHSRRSTLAPSNYLHINATTTTSNSRQTSSIPSNDTLNVAEDMAAKFEDTLQLLKSISDWRAAAQSQLEVELIATGQVLEELRFSALELCGRHLLTAALPLGVTHNMVQTLLANIQHQQSDPLCWFNDIQNSVVDALEDDELSQADLWRFQPCPELFLDSDFTQAVTQTEQLRDGDRKLSNHHNDPVKYKEPAEMSKSSMFQPNLQENSTDLRVRIIETGLMQEKGRSFGIYAVAVSRLTTDQKELWHVYRRYRDFHDLHCSVKEKWPELANLPFPGKKTFQNTTRSVLERRMLVLDAYLQSLVNLAHHPAYTALLASPILGTFLCPKDESDSHTTATMDGVLVNSIKAGMKTLKNMPDQFANTVDGVMDGISKVFQAKPTSDTECYDTNKSATYEECQDSADEFGVTLRLLEEVLGLRGLWLRRRLLAPLRTVIAERLNKKVLEYVSSATSPNNVVQYLQYFREWLSLRSEVGGSAKRSTSEEARARLAAKVALLYACPDELKHIVGADTARRGLLMVFHLVQRSEVNERLIFVLLEGILVALFPDNNMSDLFRRLYSCSPRVSAHHRTSAT